MSQKRFMTSVKLNMLRFRKVTPKNLKTRETFRYHNFKFSRIICNEFQFKVELMRNKNLCFEGIYHKKN